MFPIRDHNPATTRPVVNYILIVANVAIFLAYVPLFADPYALAVFFDRWGIVPAKIMAGRDPTGLVTSMFLHGGWLHLIGNMLFLHIFGDNIEDQLGHAGYAVFYGVCGIGAGVMQVVAEPGSPIPMVGASGAIAGVMGAYLLMFPRARIDLFLFLIVIVRIVPVPAWAMLGLWFAMQIVNGSAAPSDTGGVAYWAHAGGFALGLMLMLPVWLRRGGPLFWRRNRGAPAHPRAEYRFGRTDIPRVRRQRGTSVVTRIPVVRRRR